MILGGESCPRLILIVWLLLPANQAPYPEDPCRDHNFRLVKVTAPHLAESTTPQSLSSDGKMVASR